MRLPSSHVAYGNYNTGGMIAPGCATRFARRRGRPGPYTLWQRLALNPGTRLGPYEILSSLGAGGMGEVYRARDTKLNRDVAIKVLPDLFAGDAERLARFTREAQTLAAINHPNIAHIHGLEESGGVRALVMELVEGDDLSQRIARGAIPIDEALPIAKQIAEALEAAHEQGIIHRDLKPANIKVRADGIVKVLDFGLAKAMEPAAGASPGMSMASTVTPPAMTQAGMILGTAAYMSPEQARGTAVSKRSDIWAFGCVLFEMLTGTRAFAGNGLSDTIAAVLRAEPDWTSLGPRTPAPIRTLLKRCLEKDHARRLRDIGDARFELDAAHESAVLDAMPATAGRRNERLAWMVAMLALSLAGLGLGAWAMRETPALNEVRLDLNVPATVDPLDLASFAVSPDAQTVVFVAASDGQLWIRPLSSPELRPLRGTEGAHSPFWSPDSRSVGFFADGFLKRIDLDGELVRPLADAGAGVGGSWNRDGVIVFGPTPASPIFRVSADGGPAAGVTQLAEGHAGHSFPVFLPDGRHFLHYVKGTPTVRGVYVTPLDGAEPRRLFDADSGAAYVSGHLVFLRQGRLLAHAFDAERLEVSGVPFSTGVEGVVSGLTPAISATPAGVIAVRLRAAAAEYQFVWVDRAGNLLETVGDRNNDQTQSPNLSPDGSHLVLMRRGSGNTEVWLLELRRGLPSKLTDYPAENIFPIWSRDGTEIVFSSNRSRDGMGFYRRNVTVGGDVLLLPPTPGSGIAANDWSPDDQFLLYQKSSGDTRGDLWALPLFGTKTPVPVVQDTSDARGGQFSPDGKWVAYSSNRSGRFEVYLQPFPGQGGEKQVSTGGGAQVRWGSKGRELFYVALDGRLTAVSIEFASDGPSPGIPVPLFATRMGRAVQFVGAQYSRVGRRAAVSDEHPRAGEQPHADQHDLELEAPAVTARCDRSRAPRP